MAPQNEAIVLALWMTGLPTPELLACTSLSHLLLGMMKADGIVTEAEEKKVEILAHKFAHGLPMSQEALLHEMRELLDSGQYHFWKPQEHLSHGLDTYEAFADTAAAKPDHARVCLVMLDILAEVDGLTPVEEQYLATVREAFVNRYGEAALV